MSVSWNLSQISRKSTLRGANPLCGREHFGVLKGVGRQRTTFTSCQNAACPMIFFLLRVVAPRETENNAYAKFWSEQKRVLWYVIVFSAVVNTRIAET